MFKHQNAFRKFLAASTVAALVTSAVPAGSAAEIPFTDVSGQYTNGVGYLHANGVVNGTSPVTYGTNNQIKRGDTAVIIARALEVDTENAANAGFTDVGRYAPSVNALFADGIISGISKSEFNPNGTLTRGAMAKILVEAYDLPAAGEKSPFKDAVGVFGSYIDSLYAAGITGGKSADMFGTNSEITRGEFAVLLYKTIKKFGSVVTPELTVDGITDSMFTQNPSHTFTVSASEGADVAVFIGETEVAANPDGLYDVTLAEGENTITVTASSYGVEKRVTKTVTLDTASPALSVSEVAEVVNAAELGLEINTEEETDIEVTVNGVTVENPSSILLAEGDNTIVISAVDAAGNKSVVEKTVILDTASPALSVSEVAEVVNVAELALEINTEEEAEVEVTMNGVKVENPSSIILAEGDNTIVISAVDAAGNKSVVEKTVTLDTVSPALSVSEVAEVVNAAELAIEINNEEEAEVEVTVNGVAVDNPSSIILEEGTNIIVISAVDAVGNKSVVEKTVTYINLVKEAETAVAALEEATTDLNSEEKIAQANHLAMIAEQAVAAITAGDESIDGMTNRIEQARISISEAEKTIAIAKAKRAAEEAISLLPLTITLDDKHTVAAARQKVTEALQLDADMVIAGINTLKAAEQELEKLVFESATIRLNAGQHTMKTNQTYQLTASISPAEAEEFAVEYSTDNPDVATVDQNGLVSSITEGEANITATLENGKTAVTHIIVSDRPKLSFGYSVTRINSVITQVKTSFYNMSDETVTVKRVQLFEGSTLRGEHSEEALTKEGTTTVIGPNSEFKLVHSFNFGGMSETSYNYVKYTIETESAKTYEYISVLDLNPFNIFR